MKVLRWAALLLLVSLLACSSAEDTPGSAWQPEGPLDARLVLPDLDDSVPLLTKLPATLEIYVDASLGLKFEPQTPDGFQGSFQALDPEQREKGKLWRYRAVLRPVRLGDLRIPPFAIQAGPHEVTTGEQIIQVVAAEGGDDPDADAEAPAPPFKERFAWARLLLWGGIGLAVLILVLVAVWYRRRRPEPTPAQADELPSHVKALRALAKLRAAPRATQEQLDAFYVEVSRILRVYLEDRFGLHAPERTTEEFLHELEQDARGRLDNDQRRDLREFLRQCDLVKFAKQVPEERVHEETFRLAEGFVEQTRPDRIPA